MKIGEKEKTFVALSYELTVHGELVEKVTAESPLQFVYGAGFLLPKFEAHLKGLSKGDEFAFHLDTDDAYGPVIGEAVVDLPKEVFMVDGKVEDGLLEIGNQLPMSDNQGNRLVGVVKDVKDDVVTMDFNHPMAGKSLDFKGQVVEVREPASEPAKTIRRFLVTVISGVTISGFSFLFLPAFSFTVVFFVAISHSPYIILPFEI